MASNHGNRERKLVERAKEIITDDAYFPHPYYVTFHWQKSRRNATVITIYNSALPPNEKLFSPHGFYCIRCQIYEDDPTMLHIGLLTRCGMNGTEHLRRLIAFSKACGFSRITLEDESNINYDTKEDSTYSDHIVSLQQLLRLKTGHSWYETFGFTNETIRTRGNEMKAYILQPIGTLYPDELIFRIQDYLSEIKPEIAADNTSDITRGMSISQVAKSLYDYLIQLCPSRICKEEDLAVVDDIDSIIGTLYHEMLSQLHIEAWQLSVLQLDLLPKHNGSSRTIRRKTRRRRTPRTRRTRRL
jgi:hypothetical protein